MSPSQRATHGALRPRPPDRPEPRPLVRRCAAPETSYTAPNAASMRTSSPRNSTSVPSASPPPSTSRHRRSRSPSGHAGNGHRRRSSSGMGRPRRCRTVDHHLGQAFWVDACADRGGQRVAAPGDEHAELSALGGFEGAERAPQQRDRLSERVGRERRQPAIDDRQQFAVVDKDRAAPGEEAFDERGAGRRRRAGRERPAEARASTCPLAQ